MRKGSAALASQVRAAGNLPGQSQMKRIEVYQAWCKRCGICIAFCPKQVLEAGSASYPSAVRPENCTGCNLCELRCPDCAITVYDDEEEPDGNGTA